jgi:hypothetical protein
MKRLAISLSILAVAAVAGCGSQYYAPAMEERGAAIVPQATDYRPGFGLVIDKTAAPAPMGAATGGTVTSASGQPGNSSTWRRLAIRMNDGTLQYVDTDSNEFEPGMRVELTPDRMIRRAP